MLKVKHVRTSTINVLTHFILAKCSPMCFVYRFLKPIAKVTVHIAFDLSFTVCFRNIIAK